LSGAHAFNVCTGQPSSVLQLAQTIAELCGWRPELRFMPVRLGDIKHSYGDPRAARDVLGLGRPTALRVGLATTLAARAS